MGSPWRRETTSRPSSLDSPTLPRPSRRSSRLTDTTSCTTSISVSSSPAPPTSELDSEPEPWLSSPTSPEEKTSRRSALASPSRPVVSLVSTPPLLVELGISPTPIDSESLRLPSLTSSSKVSPTSSDGKACSREENPSKESSLSLSPASPFPNEQKENEDATLGKHFLFNRIKLR